MAQPPDQPSVPAGWSIKRIVPLAEGIGGRVWRVERDDGSLAIVKTPSKAALPDAARAADYLKWRHGKGSVRLIGAEGGTHLLEHAGERRLLDYWNEHGDQTATDIAAETVRRLHAPSPRAVPALTPLDTHFASLFERAVNGASLYFRDIARFARSVLDGQRDVQPLHGDIHHENILYGPRGWLTIDPKGLLGDPAYDAANMFHNPVGYFERESEARILNVAETMAAAVGRDVETVLRYAVAYSGLSASWWLDLGHKQAAESTVAIGEAIKSAFDQIRS